MMISAVDVWTFVHILLFVYWLGADLGVFIAAQAAKRSTLTYPQRSTALQLALKVDIAPRLSFALMFACGLELAAAKGLVEPAAWQRALAWAATNTPRSAPSQYTNSRMCTKVQTSTALIIGRFPSSAWRHAVRR